MSAKEGIRRTVGRVDQMDALYAQVLKEIEKSDLENADYVGIEAALKEFSGTSDAGKAKAGKKPWTWMCSPIFTPKVCMVLGVAAWYALLLGNAITALYLDQTRNAPWTVVSVAGGLLVAVLSGFALFLNDHPPSYFTVAVESLERVKLGQLAKQAAYEKPEMGLEELMMFEGRYIKAVFPEDNVIQIESGEFLHLSTLGMRIFARESSIRSESVLNFVGKLVEFRRKMKELRGNIKKMTEETAD